MRTIEGELAVCEAGKAALSHYLEADDISTVDLAALDKWNGCCKAGYPAALRCIDAIEEAVTAMPARFSEAAAVVASLRAKFERGEFGTLREGGE